jgi:hypothetical protein
VHKLAQFATRRADGRSDAQCILDLVSQGGPRRLFTHAELLDVVNEERHIPLPRFRLSSVVSRVKRRLLQVEKRALASVPGTGYRILDAAEHLPKALSKKRAAERYLHDGVELLRNVRSDELTPAMAQLIEGQYMMFVGLYAMVKETERRQARIEQVVEEMRRYIPQLQAQPSAQER